MPVYVGFETRAYPEIYLWFIAEIEPELMAVLHPKASPGKELWRTEPRARTRTGPENWILITLDPMGWSFDIPIGERLLPGSKADAQSYSIYREIPTAIEMDYQYYLTQPIHLPAVMSGSRHTPDHDQRNQGSNGSIYPLDATGSSVTDRWILRSRIYYFSMTRILPADRFI